MVTLDWILLSVIFLVIILVLLSWWWFVPLPCCLSTSSSTPPPLLLSKAAEALPPVKIEKKKKRVLAFSLWGTATAYNYGALDNALLAQKFYPGWICRYYVGTSALPCIVRALEQLPNVEVIRKPQGNNHVNMLWRFEATVDPDVEIVCLRDTDSRVGQREAAAVQEWLASPYDVHIMRDCGKGQHKFEIPGGMWGLRTRILDKLGMRKGWSQLLAEKQAPQQRKQNNWFCQDQNTLKDWFYPKVLNHILAHDEFYDFQSGVQKRSFPIKLSEAEHQQQFVGRIDFEVHCITEMKQRLFPNDWPKDWTHLDRYRATQDSSTATS